jgi:hypothetical protein
MTTDARGAQFERVRAPRNSGESEIDRALLHGGTLLGRRHVKKLHLSLGAVFVKCGEGRRQEMMKNGCSIADPQRGLIAMGSNL